MSKLIKNILVICAVFLSIFVTTNLTTNTPAYAESGTGLDGCRNLLGMTAWDCGVDLENITNDDELVNSIIVIISNILTDLTVIATYLVIGFVIYGGYLYIFASGDPGKVAAGKRTLTHAFIGLAIVLSAYAIFNSIRIAFMGGQVLESNCASSTCVDPVDFVTNTITWFIGTAGVVALIFVIVGGVGYVTSAGDPSKLKKSKDTILYSLIGMAIVALALTITAFVSNIIKGA